MAARADTGVPPLIDRLRATPFCVVVDGVGDRTGVRDGDEPGGSVDGLRPPVVLVIGFFVTADILMIEKDC